MSVIIPNLVVRLELVSFCNSEENMRFKSEKLLNTLRCIATNRADVDHTIAEFDESSTDIL